MACRSYGTNGTSITEGVSRWQTDVAGTGTYTEVVGRSIAVNAFGRIIATLDLGSLIEGRGASGRDKDLAGLAELESPLEANGQAEAPAPHL